MLLAVSARRPLWLGLAALVLLRCGACDSESGGPRGQAGADAALDASSGGAKGDAPSGGGASADAPTGGAGVGGIAGDSGLPPEQAWLDDPSAWKLVPGTDFTQPTCPVYEAFEGKLGFPKLSWQGCGAGCEVADLVQGYGSGSALPVASTHQLAGGPLGFLLHTLVVKTASTWFNLRRVIRLDDGVTMGALAGRRQPNAPFDTCIFGNGRESARANVLMGGEPGSEMRMVAPIAGGQWIWSLPAKLQSTQPIGLVEFDIDALGGAMFMTGKGGVWALLDPNVTKWTPLETPSKSERGAGEGDLAVWTDYPTSGAVRIRGWAPDGKGVRTLIDPAPKGTCRLNVTQEAIVGLALEGGGGCGTPPATKARFWWSPRKYDALGAGVTFGPDLPGSNFAPMNTLPLRAWGNHVAVAMGLHDDAGALDGSVYFLILNTSTGKLWRLDAEPGHRIHPDAWTLTPTHLYYADHESADGPFIVRRVLRFELAKLDQVAKPQN